MADFDGKQLHCFRWRGSTPPPEGKQQTWRNNLHGTISAVSFRGALDRLEQVYPGIEVHMLNHEGKHVQ